MASASQTIPLFPISVARHANPFEETQIPLQSLSPRAQPSSPRSPVISSAERPVSVSPPPSFYRAVNHRRDDHDVSQSSYTGGRHSSIGSRGSRASKERESQGINRKIQFAAPPPPVFASVVLPRSPQRKNGELGGADRRGSTGSRLISQSSIRPTNPILPLRRRERALQQSLQAMLDAQSTGLLAGVEATDTSPFGSQGSSTPTTSRAVSLASKSGRNMALSGVLPIRQPRTKPVGLKGARRGLLRDMHELAKLKEEELMYIEDDMAKRQRALARVQAWEARSLQLKGELDTPAISAEDVELADLQSEETALDAEIKDLEERLVEMRARKRRIRERLNTSVNRKEARLSGFRGSLSEIERDTQRFLRQSPVGVSFHLEAQDLVSESVWDLPASRRTLAMVREEWMRELELLADNRHAADSERLAAEQGAVLWSQSTDLIAEFEQELLALMQAQNSGDGSSLLHTQLGKMRAIIQTLAKYVDMAESKGYNLLTCAIGAELEAFREGERLLSGSNGAEDLVRTTEPALLRDATDMSSSMTNGGAELYATADEGQLRRERSGESEDEKLDLAELMVERNGEADGQGDDDID